MMDGTFGIGTNPFDLALLGAFRDNRFSGVLARLVFRPVSLLFPLRLVLPDFDVLVPGNRRAAVLRLSVGGTDLYQLRFCGDGQLYVSIQFGLEAFGITARIGLAGSEIGEEQNIVPGALWALNSGTRFRHKLCVLF